MDKTLLSIEGGGIKLSYKYLMKKGNKRYYKFENEIVYNVEGEKIENPTKYVVVSDATTHAERLVFPIYIMDGFTEEDLLNYTKGCLDIDFLQIAGNMTMLIFNGDRSSMREDEYYLNQLLEANKITI